MMGLGCFLFPLVHALRRNYLYKQTLLAQLASFDVKHARCQCESDEAHIHAAIVHWYGSLHAFSEHVRGPLREELMKVLEAPGFPFGYAFLLSTPMLSTGLEVWVAYWKGGATLEGMLAYTLAMVFGMNFVWFPAMWALLIFSCEKGIGFRSFRCRPCCETVALALIWWFLFLFGTLCGIRAYASSLTLALLWLAIAVLFAGSTARYLWRK